jgi:antitoxin VapB
MALNIKNRETEQLARELARRRGTSITEAVTYALRKEVALRNEVERKQRTKPREEVEERLRRIKQIVERFNARPRLDDRSDDEILGYHEPGLFN